MTMPLSSIPFAMTERHGARTGWARRKLSQGQDPTLPTPGEISSGVDARELGALASIGSNRNALAVKKKFRFSDCDFHVVANESALLVKIPYHQHLHSQPRDTRP